MSLWIDHIDKSKVDSRVGSNRTFEDANSGREVVDAASGLQGGGEDLNGRDEIVGEAVVQIPLYRGHHVSLN